MGGMVNLFRRGKFVVRFFVSIVVVILAGVLMAPAFLVFSQQLEKVDCAIVMVGGEPGARVRGAEQLVKQGRVGALLIPAYHKVAFVEDSGLGKRENIHINPVLNKTLTLFGRKFRVFENTHLEMIMGKMIMDKLGYRSAIIVSSPYHMRRLKLIAGKVFGDGDYRIGFEATPFEKYDTWGCFRSWGAFENVVNEYLKIGWFLVYSWFV